MLVMTTIFTDKIEELPPTSDMKMIDIWLIFCLVVPFLEVILRTAIECVNCSCHICEPEEADKDKDKAGKEDRKMEIDLVQELQLLSQKSTFLPRVFKKCVNRDKS